MLSNSVHSVTLMAISEDESMVYLLETKPSQKPFICAIWIISIFFTLKSKMIGNAVKEEHVIQMDLFVYTDSTKEIESGFLNRHVNVYLS